MRIERGTVWRVGRYSLVAHDGGVRQIDGSERSVTVNGSNMTVIGPPSAALAALYFSAVSADVASAIFTRIAVSTTPYSASSGLTNTTVTVLGVDTSSVPISVVLPAANLVEAAKVFLIVDENGNANSNNITVTVSGGGTISGDTSFVLAVPYVAMMVYSNGTNWNIC